MWHPRFGLRKRKPGVGPNDGAEHKEIATKVIESLAVTGILPSRVKYVVSDEGSTMVAAFNRRLSEYYPNSKLHICVAHKLHGTGVAMTKTHFEELDMLLQSARAQGFSYGFGGFDSQIPQLDIFGRLQISDAPTPTGSPFLKSWLWTIPVWLKTKWS